MIDLSAKIYILYNYVDVVCLLRAATFYVPACTICSHQKKCLRVQPSLLRSKLKLNHGSHPAEDYTVHAAAAHVRESRALGNLFCYYRSYFLCPMCSYNRLYNRWSLVCVYRNCVLSIYCCKDKNNTYTYELNCL